MSNIFIRTTIAPYRVDTYNALSERGFKMFFYKDKDPDIKNMALILKECKFKPYYLKGITFGRTSRTLCYGLWSLIRRESPRVVIVPEFQFSFWQILIYKWFTRSSFKIVSMCDDSYDMIANDNSFSMIHKWLRYIAPRFMNDIIVLDSRVKDWYQKHFRKGIWLPILRDDKLEIANYKRVLPISRSIAAEYNLYNKKVILFVGRLVGLKNISRIISAYDKTQEDSILVIVGDGEMMEQLKKESNAINKDVIFTGRVEGDMLKAWYNVGDVFILLSIQEAYGAVTNEALLAGNRVVISKNAGSSCLVTKNNGEIVDPYDIESVAKALDNQLRLVGEKNGINERPSYMDVSFIERITNLENKLSLKKTM
ncbi:MAG: glycosyltransferase family 4 protein [Bacteroidaceae bacterium]|nr:glycosyltransferase family 4 protein [Bacteroidaceae bacterium]